MMIDLQNHIASIFKMFATVYSNNDLHFVKKDVRELFKKHEVVHYINFITSSSFTELLE